ncbi:MAG: DNA methyltransferase [Candidatus Hodarchaeota archaeon]
MVINRVGPLKSDFDLFNQDRLFQAFQRQKKTKFHPAHSIHRWYGKLMPSTPRWAIKEFSKPGDVVYDPFCGSGTVCLEAMLKQRQVIGNDIDPLACLISRVKTTRVDPQLIEKEFEWIQTEYKSLDPEIPNFPRRDYWFTSSCQITLGRILAAISQIEHQKVSEFFRMCFSSIVRASSFADPKFIITARSKHRQQIAEKMTSEDVWKFFSGAVIRNIKRMERIWRLEDNFTYPIIHCGDAREYIPNQRIDIIVTNPPYVGSVDYVRAMRLPRYWLKLSSNDLQLRHAEIGSRIAKNRSFNAFSAKYRSLSTALVQMRHKNVNKSSKSKLKFSTSERTLLAFIIDMEKSFLNLDKVLKPKGIAIIRIGDNKLGRSEVKLGDFICELIERIGWIERIRIKDPVIGRSLFGTKRYSKTNPDKLEYSWIIGFQKTS